MKVYPAPGLSVRIPGTRNFVPADGLEVPDNDVFWAKLLDWGDVVTTKPAEAAPAAAKPDVLAKEPMPSQPPPAAPQERKNLLGDTKGGE